MLRMGKTQYDGCILQHVYAILIRLRLYNTAEAAAVAAIFAFRSNLERYNFKFAGNPDR